MMSHIPFQIINSMVKNLYLLVVIASLPVLLESLLLGQLRFKVIIMLLNIYFNENNRCNKNNNR